MRPILLVPALGCALSMVPSGGARAEGPPPADATFRVRSSGPLTVDGGLQLATPAGLATGLSTGVGAGAMIGGRWAFGARASWSTSTESSIAWTLTRADLRLRAAGAIQQAAGRGRFALRLSLGATVVHETRVRNQGAQAQLTGSDLQTSVFAPLPAGELEAVIALHVAGPWLLELSGGPGLAIDGGSAHGGWTAALGVGWQP